MDTFMSAYAIRDSALAGYNKVSTFRIGSAFYEFEIQNFPLVCYVLTVHEDFNMKVSRYVALTTFEDYTVFKPNRVHCAVCHVRLGLLTRSRRLVWGRRRASVRLRR